MGYYQFTQLSFQAFDIRLKDYRVIHEKKMR